VTFVQRFGGALNLHPHFHTLVPDGLFAPRHPDTSPDTEQAPLTFVALPAPTPEEIEVLTERIARRVTALIVRVVDGGVSSRSSPTLAPSNASSPTSGFPRNLHR
jgi:hypothetical protein